MRIFLKQLLDGKCSSPGPGNLFFCGSGEAYRRYIYFLLQFPDGMHHLPLVRQRIVDHVRSALTVDRRHIQ